MSNPLETQVGGGHYKDLKIQPVEFIHANGLGFMEGAVIKYVARHKAKNGRQDIEKAIHFLQLLLELEYPDELPGEAGALFVHGCTRCELVWEDENEDSECPGCIDERKPAPAPIAESEESTGAGATLDQSFRWPVRMGEQVATFEDVLGRLYKERAEKPEVVRLAGPAFGASWYTVKCALCEHEFIDRKPLHSRCRICDPASYDAGES